MPTPIDIAVPRPALIAPMVPIASSKTLAAIKSISSLEIERNKVRSAIAIEGYAAPGNKALTAINYLAALLLFVVTVALLFAAPGAGT